MCCHPTNEFALLGSHAKADGGMWDRGGDARGPAYRELSLPATAGSAVLFDLLDGYSIGGVPDFGHCLAIDEGKSQSGCHCIEVK